MVRQLRLSVPEMGCAGCAASVHDALMSGPGVSRADVDLKSKQVTVEYDAEQTTPDALRGRVSEAGFDATII